MTEFTTAPGAAGDSPSQRNWQSVRTVIEALSLAGILWLASSVQSQNNSIVKLQIQIEMVQASLSGVPGLDSRVTKLETNQVELIRRVGRVEDAKSKGWTQ